MTIARGKKAPAFTLPDQDGKDVSLQELTDKWVVLYFYPRDDTPGCTVEALEFTALNDKFEKAGALVLGISADSGESHCKFIAKHKLAVRLLTDKDHAVMAKYDAYGEKILYGKKSIGVKRSTAIISPDGKIAHHWKSVKARGHAEKVLEKLAELQ